MLETVFAVFFAVGVAWLVLITGLSLRPHSGCQILLLVACHISQMRQTPQGHLLGTSKPFLAFSSFNGHKRKTGSHGPCRIRHSPFGASRKSGTLCRISYLCPCILPNKEWWYRRKICARRTARTYFCDALSAGETRTSARSAL